MSVLESFGFKVYRLREVKESDEFLLFDIEKKLYNQYSAKRFYDILDSELYENGIDYKEIAVNELSYSDNIKKISLLKDWVSRECKLIHNLSYQPSDEMIFEEDNKLFFNIYKKSKLLKQECSKKEFPHIKRLMLNLVGNNEEEFYYFINWIGWQIQNPLKRLPTSIILQGEQGTGKTQFCELVLKKLFASNFMEIGQTEINNDHNDFILGKQLIVANEVIHNDNKFLVPDKLKRYVTDEYLSINKKYKDTIYCRNFSQWIFVSNNDMPLKIDKGDRRYTIFKSKKLTNGFELIGNLINNLQEELEGFVYYIKNLNIDYDYVSTPLMNEAKKDLIKLSQNSVEEFIDFIREIGGFDNYVMNVNFESTPKGLCLPTQVIYEIYCRFCVENGITHKFTRRNFTMQLKKAGLIDDIVRINEKTTRVILLEGIK